VQSAEPSDVLFLGGRSGAGKSSVALEVSHLLARAEVSHAVIEGDYLDLAHPTPWVLGLDLAERNLRAVWQNYRAAGYSRLIYTNTVSVLRTAELEAALGGTVRSVGVLLTATDRTARSRLTARERGSELDSHLECSARAARRLDVGASDGIHRVATDGRSVADIAREVLRLMRWHPEALPSV
jgi:hypothetical protein